MGYEEHAKAIVDICKEKKNCHDAVLSIRILLNHLKWHQSELSPLSTMLLAQEGKKLFDLWSDEQKVDTYSEEFFKEKKEGQAKLL